jgi:hypothetical protein
MEDEVSDIKKNMARIRLNDGLRALLAEARTSGLLSVSEPESQPSLLPNAAGFDEASLRALLEEEAAGALSTKSLRLLHATLKSRLKVASASASECSTPSSDDNSGSQAILRAIVTDSKAGAGNDPAKRVLIFPKTVRFTCIQHVDQNQNLFCISHLIAGDRRAGEGRLRLPASSPRKRPAADCCRERRRRRSIT